MYCVQLLDYSGIRMYILVIFVFVQCVRVEKLLKSRNPFYEVFTPTLILASIEIQFG